MFNTFLRKLCIYETVRENVVEAGRPQMTM